MKRTIALLITTVTLLLLVAIPVQAESPDMVEISISMFDRGGIPGDEGTYEDNVVTRYINEHMNELGVNISWISAPRNDARTKFNAMIAAGTNPDILWEYSRPWMDQLRVQEVIIPLDEWIEKYSVQYKEYAAANADLLAPFITLEDGNVYAAASLRKLTEMPVAGIWYRKDLLDAEGLEVPTTMDEVIEICRYFKEKDDTMVPIAGSLHFENIIYGVYGMGSTEVIEDGELIPMWKSRNYYDAMSTLKLLFEEKLIDQEYITDENMTRQNQFWAAGKSVFYFSGWNLNDPTKELMATVEGADPYPLPNIGTEYGTFFLTPQALSYIYTMFTAAMSEEQIEAGIKYLDWLLTDDNWYTIKFGREGERFNYDENGFRVGIPGAIAWPGGEYALVTMDEYVPGEIAAGDVTEYKVLSERYEANMKNMFSYPISNVLPYDYSSDAYATLTAEFTPIRTDIQTQMVSNPNYTIEQGVADLEAAWDSLGGSEIWAAKVAWYEENEEMYMAFRDAWIEWMLVRANAIP